MYRRDSDGLTAEKVASYLPLSGHQPDIPGRIINVTHQIPYNILRTPPTMVQLPSPPRSPPPTSTTATEAPISRVSRKHQRSHTLRAKFHSADWTVVQRRGHAALYSGIQSLNKHWESIHIGWTGPIHVKGSKKIIDEVSDQDKVTLQKLLWDTGRIVPIFLDNTSRGHYEGYCKEGMTCLTFVTLRILNDYNQCSGPCSITWCGPRLRTAGRKRETGKITRL